MKLCMLKYGEHVALKTTGFGITMFKLKFCDTGNIVINSDNKDYANYNGLLSCSSVHFSLH